MEELAEVQAVQESVHPAVPETLVEVNWLLPMDWHLLQRQDIGYKDHVTAWSIVFILSATAACVLVKKRRIEK